MRFIQLNLKISNPFKALASTDRQVLAVCLGAAFVFWLSLNLSQEYEVTKEVTIDYRVSPDRVMAGLPPTSIPVLLKAQGWNLIWESLRGSTIPVTVNLKDQPKFELTNVFLQQEIRRNLSSGSINIISLNYEARPVLTTPLEGKRVPVVSRLNLNFSDGYLPSSPVRFSPDSVTVSGAADRLDTILYWPTARITLNDIQDDLTAEVPLVSPPTGLRINYDAVALRQPVEAFIEQRISVPVTVRNAPKADSSRVFPDVVILHVTLPQSDFDRYDASDFTLVANLDDLRTSEKQNSVPLKLENYPEEVHGVIFEPRAVEYYVYRR